MLTYHELDEIVKSANCTLASTEYDMVQRGRVAIINKSEFKDEEVVEYVNSKIKEYGCWSQLSIDYKVKDKRFIKCNIR